MWTGRYSRGEAVAEVDAGAREVSGDSPRVTEGEEDRSERDLRCKATDQQTHTDN